MEIIRTFVRDRVVLLDCGHGSDCWLWGRSTRDGYGRAALAGRTYQAHRISYEAFVGPIPDGLEIDHLCCVTNCVNPEHLEAVSREENHLRKVVRRGYVVGGRARLERATRGPRKPAVLQTHCRYGHEYTLENTKFSVNQRGYPYRACRECLRKNSRIGKLRRRAKKAIADAAAGGATDDRLLNFAQTHLLATFTPLRRCK